MTLGTNEPSFAVYFLSGLIVPKDFSFPGVGRFAVFFHVDQRNAWNCFESAAGGFTALRAKWGFKFHNQE
jgi:hypothetical protein